MLKAAFIGAGRMANVHAPCLKKIPGSTFLCALANKIYGRNS